MFPLYFLAVKQKKIYYHFNTVLRTDSCIRRPQYICELLQWHAEAGKKENLSLGHIAACISNWQQIKVTIIFVALLCCQWPLLNGASEGGDRWILPHQPCQEWHIFGSHRNARTEKPPTKTNNKTQQQDAYAGPAVFCFSWGKKYKKIAF